MRRIIFALLLAVMLTGASIFIPQVRSRVKAIVRPEPPAQITPLALTLPPTQAAPTTQPTQTPRPASARATPNATATVEPTVTIAPPLSAAPTPASGPVEVNGRLYDAYIPAATKPGQFFQYSCEFDAAWVVLETYGIPSTGEELIDSIEHDRSIEPRMEETGSGFVIYGGDITTAYSGDYTKNYLARSTGAAMQTLFANYGLETTRVSDRAGIQAALRRGELVWMKTTVDFKPWRPATWVMPDGRTYQTVLGNDHAVVAMGFSERSVVIRDVLGPTSTNRNRPYEYEVDWETFMAAWGAQSYDGLAVARPNAQP